MRGIWAGVLLVCYLGATSLLLLAAGQRVPATGLAWHIALLAVLAVACWAPGVPRWLRHWSPLLALLFLYSEMPLLIRAAGHESMQDAVVIAWEQTLFAGQPALEWARRWPSRALSELLHGGYLSYYGIIFVVPAGLHLTRRWGELSDAVFVLMLTFVVCFVCYLFFPVAGPRYVWPPSAQATDGTLRGLTIWLLEARSSQGTAFPSSHVAVSVTQCLLALRYFGRKGWWLVAITILLAAGAIHGGYHYAVDVLAGAALGAVTTAVGLGAIRRDQAKASAPT